MKTSYRTAVHDALRDALRDDPRVVLMGEDVGRYGGTYAASKGLLDEFGPDRVRDTPLSELGFVGIGIGAALGGLRPIVEVMTVNFSLLALDQIVNTAAALRHMSGGQFSVPLVVRMATGAGRQLGAQHSHSLEPWYAHIPGIKVLAPATVEDAYGMLGPALADPDPVVIFEHVQLYNASTDVDALAPIDISRAAVRRPGTDVTVITYGGCLPKALDAANELSLAGIDCEVIDLRVLRPLDDDTILESVRKTHRAVVVDEAWHTGSLAAEVMARVMEGAFYDLDAPVARVCSAEVPMPYAKHLEQAALPQTRQDRRRRARPARAAFMIEFKMPSLGSDMDEGTLDEWLVKPGDTVARGQVVAIVETTKAAVEVECWQEGTVSELLVPVGETVQVGTTLATLLAPGERAEQRPRPRPARKAATKPATAPPTVPPVTAAPAVRSPAGRPRASSLGIAGRAATRPITACRHRRGAGHRPAGRRHHQRRRARRRGGTRRAAERQDGGQADGRRPRGTDAQVDRGRHEPVQAGDPALLPRRRDPAGKVAELADDAKCAALHRRTGTARRLVVEGRRPGGATVPGVQRILARSTGSSPRPGFTSASGYRCAVAASSHRPFTTSRTRSWTS